jgi:hypothetical protein
MEKQRLSQMGFEAAADIALVHDNKVLVVPDMKAGSVTFIGI